MRQFLLVGLFAILLSDIMLHLGLTLGPGLSLKNAVLYLLFMVLVFEFATGRRDPLLELLPLNTAWFVLVVLATFTWLVLVLLGIHRSYDTVGSFIALKSQLVDLFLFMLVYMYGPKNFASTLSMLKWLITILIVVNIVTMIDVFNIPDLGIIEDRTDGRLSGPVNEVNQYGAVLIFIIPITAGLWLASNGALKAWFGIGTLIAFVLLGLTVSRGSWLGLFVGSAAALFLVRAHLDRRVIVKGALLSAGAVILVAAVIAVQNPEGFMQKFNFAGSSLDTASSGRIDFWRQALTMMSVTPISFITGYGWNAYATLFIGYGDPHNTYLMYWFNLGIWGLGIYAFIAIWILRYAVNSLKQVEAGVKPVVIGFIVGFMSLHAALFFVGLYAPWMFIWAIGGAVLRLLTELSRPLNQVQGPAQATVGIE